MRDRKWAVFGAAFAVALTGAQPLCAQTTAQTGTASKSESRQILIARIEQLPAAILGTVAKADYFAPSFLAALPAPQIDAFSASLRAAGGDPTGVTDIAPVGASAARFTLTFERATADVEIAVDASGRVAQLLVRSLTPLGDTPERLTAEIAALPGITGWGIYRLDASGGSTGAATLLAGAGNTRDLAIGSAFKLSILGALDAEIAAGRMHWADVLALDRRSIPTGILQDWPEGAPVTLHSLAALMISRSDNTATDLLLRHVGRDRVEAFARAHGGLSGPNAFPLLSTIEATVLKNPAIGAARADWLAGDEAARREILRRHADLFTTDSVDIARLSGEPADIDRIEWFASPDSIARLFGWFAGSASNEARALLSINPGLPPAVVRSMDYAGYKGGSEPGVIAVNYLIRAADGRWFAVAMAWNNEAAAVDDSAFAALAARAVTLAPTLDR